MMDRSLELTIISAKGLNKVNLVGKMNVYAVVYIHGAVNQDHKKKTHVDKDGDSNPTWNYPMKFKIDESAALQNRLTLIIKIKTEWMLGDWGMGKVHVPVKELLEGVWTGSKPLRFVSYEVRKPCGKPKGELSFSYKFGEKTAYADHHQHAYGIYPLPPPPGYEYQPIQQKKSRCKRKTALNGLLIVDIVSDVAGSGGGCGGGCGGC